MKGKIPYRCRASHSLRQCSAALRLWQKFFLATCLAGASGETFGDAIGELA
jgi:hypothetical protein